MVGMLMLALPLMLTGCDELFGEQDNPTPETPAPEEKKAGTISFATASVGKTFGDAAFTIELTNTGDGTVTYESSNTAVATVDATTGEITIVGSGETTITATVADTDNYTYATKTATYTLGVGTATMTVSAEGFSCTYDNNAHSITITVPEGATIKYGITEGTYTLDAIPTFTDAGTYTVYYQVTMFGYTPVTGSVDIVISKADMTVTADGYSGTYDGETHGISVNVASPSGATVKYGTAAGTYDKAASPVFTDAGTHTVYYEVTKDNYNTVTGSAAVVISKKAAAISYETASVAKTNTSAAFTNALAKTGDGTVTYESSNAAVATVNASTGEVTVTGAGTATITATVSDGTNYTYAVKTATYTVTVSAEPSSIVRGGYENGENPF